jgi:hypothetical protein
MGGNERNQTGEQLEVRPAGFREKGSAFRRRLRQGVGEKSLFA